MITHMIWFNMDTRDEEQRMLDHAVQIEVPVGDRISNDIVFYPDFFTLIIYLLYPDHTVSFFLQKCAFFRVPLSRFWKPVPVSINLQCNRRQPLAVEADFNIDFVPSCRHLTGADKLLLMQIIENRPGRIGYVKMS